MKWLIIILFLITLSSCVTGRINHHLRQAEKHLRKAEQLGGKVQVDTVYKEIRVLVPQTKFDTLVSILRLTDTLTITKDRAVTKIKLDTLLKKVYISTECLPDTLKIRVPVSVTKEVKSSFPWGWLIIAWCIGAIMGLVATRRR